MSFRFAPGGDDHAVESIAERVARNEATFRDANERIERAADGMAHLEQIPFICECAVRDCTEIVPLSRAEYEGVRRSGTTFWVAPGHELTHVDGVEVAKVVERSDRFTTMAKIGEAGRIAAELDPRSPTESTQ